MSDYTQITLFAPKDALSSGNPAKIIKGAEFDPELSAISVAVGTKYDSTDVALDAEAAALALTTKLLTPANLKYALENGTYTISATSGTVPPARTVTAAAGLTGGGDLSANRSLAVGQGTGITVNADDVALDTANTRNVDHTTVSISASTGLTGGGSIDSSRSLALDTSNTRNVDHAAVSVIAGTGLSGGGTIAADRTLNVVEANLTTRNITGKTGIAKTLSTSSASGGSDGDIWYRY